MPEELILEVDAWAEAETGRRFGLRVSRSQAIRELCARSLRSLRSLSSLSSRGDDDGTGSRESERGAVSVRAYRLGDEPPIDEETARMTPAERVAAMGDLALTAYELRGEDVAPRIRRDVVRVVRGWR